QPLSAASSPEQPVADSSPDTTMEAAVKTRQPPRRPKWIVPAVLLILVLGAVLLVLAVRNPDLLPGPFSSSPGTSNELTYGADTPQGVLDTIVEVAETGDFIPLYGLCDPLAEHDENAAYVCALATATDKRRLFRRAFAASEVVGEIVYSTDGQQAEMTFSHGPAGGIIKTAKLVQRDGRWYLLTWPPLPDDTD
ncbi:MAG: hypothetical protein R3293_24435, partial [Candidatus Promineifilaceae bacterium]|nr:hypothetical protein [Candidatus Promineifilaceae bacterium]